jgi:integrase
MSNGKTTKHKLKIRKVRGKWRVDARKIGQGQPSFDTKAIAEGQAQAMWDDYLAQRIAATEFSEEDRLLAINAFKTLGDLPRESIVDAGRFYREHHTAAESQRTVEQLIAEFLDAQKGSGTTEMGIRDYRQKLNRFAAAFKGRMLHEIATVELDRWLNEQGWGPKTRKGFRGAIRTFFRFAKNRKYVQSDPTEGLMTIKKRQLARKPGILTPRELRSLLFAAREYSGGLLLPYFSIGAFCGLRPEELKRLDWGHIDFGERHIFVPQEDAKTAQERYIDMPACLVAWLEEIPVKARRGRIYWTRETFDAVRREAGLMGKWDNSMLRHSAASHLYGLTQNATRVIAQMGHGLDTFLTHYKRAVPARQAEEYFEVLPTDPVPEVISLGRDAA